ncbi:hypothetical protein ANME2D_00199 [Candidatus Methanoperedens nitroreducens]|uniref:Uncharacterized protein n=1 Tax=Candidatus Methanoperedens nitratireducens TaxID=1392998 RepID=A0A062VD07_9EURY|nr:hypothetical protein [Candidatus Methanoperedens nitroreducens]KCZ73140.1 hypothetical protein ANME2D_00199 [Candidatus Methanoperedens nitroreducens]MDJ1422910.1 hypothetical protein [Candidatus Methanoperedens sp.]
MYFVQHISGMYGEANFNHQVLFQGRCYIKTYDFFDLEKGTADSESRLGRAQTRMPACIRGFPKGNQDADERRLIAMVVKKDDLEAIIETIEIMNNEELMEGIKFGYSSWYEKFNYIAS